MGLLYLNLTIFFSTKNEGCKNGAHLGFLFAGYNIKKDSYTFFACEYGTIL